MTLEYAKLKLNAYDLNYQIYGTNMKDDNYITVHVPDNDNNKNFFVFLAKNEYITVRDIFNELDTYPDNSTLHYINSKLHLEVIDTKLEQYPEIIDFEIKEITEVNNDTNEIYKEFMIVPIPERITPYLDTFSWNYQGMRLR